MVHGVAVGLNVTIGVLSLQLHWVWSASWVVVPWLRAIVLHRILLRLRDWRAGQEGGIMSLLTILLHVRHVL